MSKLVKILYRPVFRWAIRHTLVGRSRSPTAAERGRFTRRDSERLLIRTWQVYGELAPGVPRERKLGPHMNVHLAAATIACQRALIEEGTDREYANQLTTDCAWTIYERWGRLARRLARIRTRDPAEQMRVCIDDFLRFPFTPPCYRFERTQPEPGSVAIDMRRCPVADYMATEGASDLCVDAWCNQDFALAEQWGGVLHRTKTLAKGDDHCDFLFVADGPPSANSRVRGSEGRREESR